MVLNILTLSKLDYFHLIWDSPILLLASEISLLTGRPDSTGGCQRTLVDELGVGPSQYHHTMVHIAITQG
jgi:hypothetical protein